MRDRNRLFKLYFNENHSTHKVAKLEKQDNAQNLVIFKVNNLKKEFYQKSTIISSYLEHFQAQDSKNKNNSLEKIPLYFEK